MNPSVKRVADLEFATAEFEIDGPGGHLSITPRHDNDHANISRIRILPTADEVSD